MKKSIFFFLLFLLCFLTVKAEKPAQGQQHRVIVSTDIGGTDDDDFQSMVHLMVYLDTFDVEGIISSPHGKGRLNHILGVVDKYETDYPNLLTYSAKYPTADSVRKICKQGAIDIPGPIGYATSTEGSKWIIECARRDDPRPLNVLVWGGIEDVAQALHDAPDILPKIHVYYIGGPNKKWSVNAYQYIAENFPELWMIESNATYRGWFTGGNQSGSWSNSGFVSTYIKGYGALGNYYNSIKSTVKMGDTPSLMWLYHGDSEDPSQPSWGGQYVRAWDRPHAVFNRVTTSSDRMEQFGVLELLIPCNASSVTNPHITMKIDRDIPGEIKNDTARILFSPKNASNYSYTLVSNIPELNNKTGSITSFIPPASNKNNPSPNYPNWWTDDPSPEYMEDGHLGAKTVNKWRVDFLQDFADRMKRCKYPNNTTFTLNITAENGTVTVSEPDTAYLPGTKITLTAEPDEGYTFTKWEGDFKSSGKIITITINSDITISAIFSPVSSVNVNETEVFSVYPTTATDNVYISFQVPGTKVNSIRIVDSNGRINHNILVDTFQKEQVIDVSMLKPGIYFLLVNLISGSIQKPFVKL